MDDAPSGPMVRRATSADLGSLGRLGALLVQEHHDFDGRHFLAARNRTPDATTPSKSESMNGTDTCPVGTNDD
jgi:hypothetical protein